MRIRPEIDPDSKDSSFGFSSLHFENPLGSALRAQRAHPSPSESWVARISPNHQKWQGQAIYDLLLKVHRPFECAVSTPRPRRAVVRDCKFRLEKPTPLPHFGGSELLGKAGWRRWVQSGKCSFIFNVLGTPGGACGKARPAFTSSLSKLRSVKALIKATRSSTC